MLRRGAAYMAKNLPFPSKLFFSIIPDGKEEKRRAGVFYAERKKKANEVDPDYELSLVWFFCVSAVYHPGAG